jgi:hypothetical protein
MLQDMPVTLRHVHTLHCSAGHCAIPLQLEQDAKNLQNEIPLAMLNIEPSKPKNSGSNADDPINLAHLLGMLHIVDLIC